MTTLALALSGTATILNLLEMFVFRNLAVPAPEQLVGLYPARGDVSDGFTYEAFQTIADRQRVFTGLCGVTAGYGTLPVQFESGPVRTRPVEAVSGVCYGLLGITPSIGRLITTDDVVAGMPGHVALISNRVWRQELRGAPDVLGQTVRLHGTPLVIIGVLPAEYRGLNADEAPDIAVPLTLPPALGLLPPRVMHAVGRLRPGQGIGEARANLAAIWPDAYRSARADDAASQPTPPLRVVRLDRGFSVLRERYRAPLLALGVLGACLLILACVNVGGLLLTRWLTRSREVAVQIMLGAGRWRLAVQPLSEAMLTCVGATLVAAPIAWWGAASMGRLLWTGLSPFTLDPTPIGSTLVLTAFAGALAAPIVCAPCVFALFVQARNSGAQPARCRAGGAWRRAVVATQIALCFVLLFCAVLFLANLRGIRQLPLGYDPAGLHWVRLNSTSRTEFAPTIGYADALLSRVEAMPGVESAALSDSFGTGFQTPVLVSIGPTEALSVEALALGVSPGFFGTILIDLQQGREFVWSDVSDDGGVGIPNRTLADRLFPDGDAVGRTIIVGRAPRQRAVSVIGVADDAAPGDPRMQSIAQLYLPLGTVAPPAPALLLRPRTGANVSRAALVNAIEPFGRHEVLQFTSMREQIGRFAAQEQLLTLISWLFGGLAAVVSVGGLCAALSQSVVRRRREIGIRVAVGATPQRVCALVFADAWTSLLIGVGFGTPLALAASRAVRSLLFGDPPALLTLLTITGFGIALAVVVVSTYPAWQAVRTSAATALRAE